MTQLEIIWKISFSHNWTNPSPYLFCLCFGLCAPYVVILNTQYFYLKVQHRPPEASQETITYPRAFSRPLVEDHQDHWYFLYLPRASQLLLYNTDRLHIKNHKRPECEILYNPNAEDLKEVNTMICEQVGTNREGFNEEKKCFFLWNFP